MKRRAEDEGREKGIGECVWGLSVRGYGCNATEMWSGGKGGVVNWRIGQIKWGIKLRGGNRADYQVMHR